MNDQNAAMDRAAPLTARPTPWAGLRPRSFVTLMREAFKAAPDSAFGAAGSVVMILVRVYYSARVFLLGAEFTWVYAQHDPSRALSGRR